MCKLDIISRVLSIGYRYLKLMCQGKAMRRVEIITIDVGHTEIAILGEVEVDGLDPDEMLNLQV